MSLEKSRLPQVLWLMSILLVAPCRNMGVMGQLLPQTDDYAEKDQAEPTVIGKLRAGYLPDLVPSFTKAPRMAWVPLMQTLAGLPVLDVIQNNNKVVNTPSVIFAPTYSNGLPSHTLSSVGLNYAFSPIAALTWVEEVLEWAPHILNSNPIPLMAMYFAAFVNAFEAPQAFWALDAPFKAAYNSWAFFTVDSMDNFGRHIHSHPSKATEKNRRDAVTYSFYFACGEIVPGLEPVLRTILQKIGLHPDRVPSDPEAPRNVAVVTWKEVKEYLATDGMNWDGSMTREYNRLPFEDPTGYTPKNGDRELQHYTRWQPLRELQNIMNSGRRWGYHVTQTHLTPQAATARPTFISREFIDSTTAPPQYPDECREGPTCEAILREKALETLGYTLELADERKRLISELFDNKLLSLGPMWITTFVKTGLSFDEFFLLDYGIHTALYDGLLVSWKEKMRHDNVRPASIINHLMKDELIEAYVTGEGIRTIKGSDWTSYFRTMPHSEYPSGSTCFCLVFAEYLNAIYGEDFLQRHPGLLTTVFPKGSSAREPGMTPKEEIKIEWGSFDEIFNTCRFTRVWSGVHFKASIEMDQGGSICNGVGLASLNAIRELSGYSLNFQDR